MNDTQSKLYEAHCLEADRLEAEFYNLGWAMGDNFIHSKTSIGRLYSEISEEGNVTHEWQKPSPCVICKGEFWGYGNNPDPLAKKGICCDECNATKVIPARMANL